MSQCSTLKNKHYQPYEQSPPRRGELMTLLAKRMTALCSEESLLPALSKCWPDLLQFKIGSWGTRQDSNL